MSPNSSLEALSLRSLYAPVRENPHEKRAKIIGSVMPETGWAKPFLAAAMGKELSSAEDWDVQREEEGKAAQTAGLAAYKDKADSEFFKMTFDRILQTAVHEPGLATAMFNKMVKTQTGNKYWQSFSDIPIKEIMILGGKPAARMENGVIWTIGEDKKPRFFKGTGVDEKNNTVQGDWQIPTEEDMAALSKKDKEPKVQNMQVGGQEIPHQYNDSTGQWEPIPGKGGPKWNPKASGEEKLAKVGTVNQVNDEVAADWYDIAIKNAKANGIEDIKAEFTDPTAGTIKWQKVRSHLTPEQQEWFDEHKKAAQNYSGNMNPAAAAAKGREDMLKYRESKIGGGNKGGISREQAIEELKRRGRL